jgi:hypothetical protein
MPTKASKPSSSVPNLDSQGMHYVNYIFKGVAFR